MDNPAATVTNVTTVLISRRVVAGGRHAMYSCRTKAELADPARVRALLATIERAAASVADSSAVVGAVRVFANPRRADRRRPDAEAILADPARLGTSAAAMESSAAAIAGITTILIAGRVGAGAQRARHIGLADVVLADRAHPRTYGRAVERAATPITDGPTVVAIITGRMMDTGNWHASIKPRFGVERAAGIRNLRRVPGRIWDGSIARRCIGNACIARRVQLRLRSAGIQRAVPHVGSNHIGNQGAGIVARRDPQRAPAAARGASEDNRRKTGPTVDPGLTALRHGQQCTRFPMQPATCLEFTAWGCGRRVSRGARRGPQSCAWRS